MINKRIVTTGHSMKKHPGIAKNNEYREYAVKEGFKQDSHKQYKYGNTILSICFYPCTFGIVVTNSAGSIIDRKDRITFPEFQELVKEIISKEDAKL